MKDLEKIRLEKEDAASLAKDTEKKLKDQFAENIKVQADVNKSQAAELREAERLKENFSELKKQLQEEKNRFAVTLKSKNETIDQK